MQVSNSNMQELTQALAIVNKKYNGNIEFKRLETKGRKVIFTLKVKSGLKLDKNGIVKGAAKSGSQFNYGRRTGGACWHVHGEFFDALLAINPKAVIVSMIGTINKDGGNWVDKEVGSVMYPSFMSENCDCVNWDNNLHEPLDVI